MSRSRAPEPPSLLYAIKRLELVVRARLDEVLRDSGVTTPQYTALTVLAHRDAVSAAHLARRSFVTPQSMSQMLRVLEQRALIRRAPNPRNQRESLVHLTDEGWRLLDDCAGATAAIERQLTAGLVPADVAAFRSNLQAASASLRPDRLGDGPPQHRARDHGAAHA